MRLVVVGVMAIGILIGVIRHHQSTPGNALPPEMPWTQTAPGIEVRTLNWRAADTPAQVLVARADPSCAIRVVDMHKGVKGAGGRAGEACPLRGAAINASYFDESLNPLGLLVVEGKRLSSFFPTQTWGLFLVRRNGPALTLSAGQIPEDTVFALECKPRLVIDGVIPIFKEQPTAPRSAVGIDSQGNLILAATHYNISLETWSVILRDGLGCANALNLDGGPSTQLTTRGDVRMDVPGGWPVPVFITVAPRE